ncbi:Gata transcription factor [Thalictrum thalictroides]|uniref:Gata transcription factor n=1 Tax=Thalictrum thalictroides TaxID=46969 RepID=A0A7J6WSR2_THATH|nr:Gata transcription factor [Thalictrum thalictroides]
MNTPIYLNPSQPPFLFEEHNQAHQQLFIREDHQDDEADEKYVLRDESNDDRILSSTHSTDQASDGNSSLLQQEHEVMKEENYASSGHIHHGLSIKWMSSKMRLMKKMITTDHNVLNKQSQMASSSLDNDNSSNNVNSSSSNNNFIRTCSDCNTTKTPLWRSGPRGPKSLCNACGIRQRKARRAMAAAQAEASDTFVASETSSTNGNKLRIKAKRCKLTIRHSQKKLCFEDVGLSLSKSSAYHQVFPQDEKEAAILLMALSCGRSSSWLNGFL